MKIIKWNKNNLLFYVFSGAVVLTVNCGTTKKSMDRKGDQLIDDGSGDLKPPPAKPVVKPTESKPAVKPQVKPLPQSEETIIQLTQVDVGIKNYLQINATFSALTGIAATNAAVVATFKEVKEQLPSGNSVKNFSASTQVGISKLAASYCNALVNDTTVRAQKVPNFNFTVAVSQSLNADGETALIDGFVNSFWMSTLKPSDIEPGKTILKALLVDLKVGLATDTAAQSRAIAVGMCTAALSSTSIIML